MREQIQSTKTDKERDAHKIRQHRETDIHTDNRACMKAVNKTYKNTVFVHCHDLLHDSICLPATCSYCAEGNRRLTHADMTFVFETSRSLYLSFSHSLIISLSSFVFAFSLTRFLCLVLFLAVSLVLLYHIPLHSLIILSSYPFAVSLDLSHSLSLPLGF